MSQEKNDATQSSSTVQPLSAQPTPDQQRALERHGAQALIATYLQMTRHAQLARHLHEARSRATARRIDTAPEFNEAVRLQRQLDAQEGQGAVIDGALERLKTQAPALASFGEAGLEYEDFQRMGLEDVVDPDEVERAHAQGERRRLAAFANKNSGSID